MVDLKYIGHSAFEIKHNDKSILIDPWVSINPKYKYKDANIIDIFVTHGHSDHVGEAVEIAKEKDATITCVPELARILKEQGANTKGVGFGSWINYSWGRAVFVPAFHTSSTDDGRYAGEAAGVILDIDGVRIYHAGDTCLTSEMKTIKDLYRPTIALLPIGGYYTMDVEHAAVAAKWLEARTVIPMHYNTFPEINADVEKFVKMVSAANTMACALNPEEI